MFMFLLKVAVMCWIASYAICGLVTMLCRSIGRLVVAGTAGLASRLELPEYPTGPGLV